MEQADSHTLPLLSEMQARVLACLIEKKETTPDQYPLTVNSLRLACNQKTARHPVTQYTEGEVGHTVRELIGLDLVREAWGARVAKYEHHAGKALGVHSKALALLCPLILRGPQTAGELKVNAHRLHDFEELDDVLHMLGRMADHQPPLLTLLPRQAGQKEQRYAHLLCGEPDLTDMVYAQPANQSKSQIEERLVSLEAQVAELQRRLDEIPDS
ncbi:MAG TPA: YceH family protein [Xanthomonadales bacterium]|nr:YceH family protein [Xanthomonadales bacterium]